MIDILGGIDLEYLLVDIYGLHRQDFRWLNFVLTFSLENPPNVSFVSVFLANVFRNIMLDVSEYIHERIL